MRLFQKFLARLYLRKFLLLFIAFELFFVGFDLLKNLKRLPDSANLQILYTANKFLEFINYTLPLSLIFALLLAMLQIIKNNELVTLYALGVSKLRVAKPFVLIATLLTLLYIGLNTLPYFVQSLETSTNIRRMGTLSSVSSSIFIKSGDTYAYIEHLHPHDKSAEGMKVFRIDKGDLKEIIEARRGRFRHGHWELEEVTIMHKPQIDTARPEAAKLTITTHSKREVLSGFTPRIIDTLFQNFSRLTIQDSLQAIDLLSKQHLRTEKVRANLYMMLFFPLFAPITVFGLFFLFPAQHRGTNLPLLSTLVIFGTLGVWGILFTLTQIALNGALSPEAGIVLPILLLALAAYYIYRKHR